MAATIIPSTSGKFQKVYATLIDNDNNVSSFPLLNAYVLTDSDNNDGVTLYFGYVDQDENWYIRRTVRSGATQQNKFASGTGSYATAWTNRSSQTYQYFYEEF